MSVSTEKTVWCDSCGEFVQYSESEHGGSDEGARQRAIDKADFRRVKIEGTTVTVDLCPDCAIKMKWLPGHKAILTRLYNEDHLTENQYKLAIAAMEQAHTTDPEPTDCQCDPPCEYAEDWPHCSETEHGCPRAESQDLDRINPIDAPPEDGEEPPERPQYDGEGCPLCGSMPTKDEHVMDQETWLCINKDCPVKFYNPLTGEHDQNGQSDIGTTDDDEEVE